MHVFHNPLLCGWRTIDWRSIFRRPDRQFIEIQNSFIECPGSFGLPSQLSGRSVPVFSPPLLGTSSERRK